MPAITPFHFQSHQSIFLRPESLRKCARAASIRRRVRLS
jgi:hypothetical protein